MALPALSSSCFRRPAPTSRAPMRLWSTTSLPVPFQSNLNRRVPQFASVCGWRLKSTAQDPLLNLHIGDTTVQVPFSPSAAQGLRESFGSLLKTFAEKQKSARPQRWDMMEYRYVGPPEGPGLAAFEVTCNPNAYPSAFDAKLLINIKTRDRVSVTTEGRLSNFKSDFEAYLRERKLEAAAAGN